MPSIATSLPNRENHARKAHSGYLFRSRLRSLLNIDACDSSPIVKLLDYKQYRVSFIAMYNFLYTCKPFSYQEVIYSQNWQSHIQMHDLCLAGLVTELRKEITELGISYSFTDLLHVVWNEESQIYPKQLDGIGILRELTHPSFVRNSVGDRRKIGISIQALSPQVAYLLRGIL